MYKLIREVMGTFGQLGFSLVRQIIFTTAVFVAKYLSCLQKGESQSSDNN